jgi:signal transduction histidine kinase/CheY-like chemotaxis protein
MRLRSHLALLVAATLVPVIALAIVLVLRAQQSNRAAVERGMRETVRAMAFAIDREIGIALGRLELLARSHSVDAQDWARFRDEALAAQLGDVSWIVVTDLERRQLVNTGLPPGVAAPPRRELESYQRTIATRKPVVSNLSVAQINGQHVVILNIPVERTGAVRYVLSMTVVPRIVTGVLKAQRLPSEWYAVVYDDNRTIIARTREEERTIGQRAAGNAANEVGPDGFFKTVSREGQQIYFAYDRVPSTPWRVGLGAPLDVIDAPLRRSLVLAVAGVVCAALVAGGIATVLARRIATAIGTLARNTEALGRGDDIGPMPSSIDEVSAASSSLSLTALRLRQHARERDALLASERAARTEAEAANRAKDQFLAVLSHELRTPLNAVYGWARMLRDGQVRDADAKRALDAIVRNANSQVQLIDDLLDVSRVISGKMRLEVRSVDLGPVVEGAFDAVRPAAEAKGVGLHSVLDPRGGPVSGDPARLQQVVWNLLINAVKFTPSGGRVQVGLKRVDAHAEIMVSDTGQGIAPDVLPFVFDRFRQADSSSTRRHGGLGLGLALVKHLVELHGGSVAAESGGEGQGATFVVKLPLAITETTTRREPPPAASMDGVAHGVRLDGLKVLVVDDDSAALDLTSAILNDAGATVRVCLSAPDALQVLPQWRPDVLVSDVEMPGEDGYSLIRRVRALDPEGGGKTPAIALTAYGRTEDRMRTLSAGYSMHVPKPIHPGEFITIVASLAGRVPES